MGSPGKRGELDLRFAAAEDGRTRLVRDYARAPFHVSGTLGHDPHPDAATVYVQSPTGGVAQGDRHDVAIEAGPGSIAHVSTASATKIQSMARNYAAAGLGLTVGRDAHLEYVPEPTILHADARYAQDLTLEVGSGGTAVLSEVVVPGRLARGERFEFDRYRSRLRVSGSDGRLFEDATALRGAEERDLLGEFDVYGTLYVVAPGSGPDLAETVHDRLGAHEARAAVSRLPNDAGVFVRALGRRSGDVTDALHAAWDGARVELLGVGAPDPRRY